MLMRAILGLIGLGVLAGGLALLIIGVARKRVGLRVTGICLLAVCFLLPALGVLAGFRAAMADWSEDVWEQIVAEAGPEVVCLEPSEDGAEDPGLPDFQTATGIKLPPAATSVGPLLLMSSGPRLANEVIMFPKGFDPQLADRFRAATFEKVRAEMPQMSSPLRTVLDTVPGSGKTLIYTHTYTAPDGAGYTCVMAHQPGEGMLYFFIQADRPARGDPSALAP